MYLNQPQTWGVITSSQEKAFRVFTEVENEFAGLLNRRVYYEDMMYDEFSNGVRLYWLRSEDCLRWHRFRRVWIDNDIDDSYLPIVSPTMVHADNITYI